ncbi:MAG: hypothetical protein HYX39_05975 [Bacteroidetes bacterium]|nr:hypothetical protein [Bacteroidota bacterium]
MKFLKPIGFSQESVKFIYTFIIIFFISAGFSQVFYSVKPDYVKEKREGDNLLKDYKAAYPDTNINEFHNFFPRNFMGNLGLPSPEYIFSYGTPSLGFRFTPTPYKNDLFTEEQVTYFRTKGPYANLTGIAGSKKLQAFKLFFTHTYKDKINIAVKFNRYTSQGFYLKQQTYTNNLFITSNFTKSNKRAGYFFYFLNNSNKNRENGGIVGDTLSDYAFTAGKDLLPVKLSSASRENKEFKFMFNPWVKLNKDIDSMAKSNHYLQLKTKFNFNLYKYKDASLSKDKFYTLMYLDTARTYDSTRIMQVINEINYSVLSANKNIGFSAGYKNELNAVWQKADSIFKNNFIISNLVFNKASYSSDSIKLKTQEIYSSLTGQYIFSGANAGNYKAESKSQIVLSKRKSHRYFLNLLYENRSADYIYNYWVSNNFIWFNNGFKPQQIFQSQMGYEFNKKVGISFLFQNIKNYLFFDHVAYPRQYSNPLQNISLKLNYSSVFFKHLGFSANQIFQNTSNTSYVSVPQSISTAKLFYTGSLYNNNLQLQIGAQVQYYSSFYGYAYMPASQVFYLQDRSVTGEYPFLDVYLNARIRPVNVFLKVENVLQGFVGKNYAFVPGYYQTDRAFRFGISWMFFD